MVTHFCVFYFTILVYFYSDNLIHDAMYFSILPSVIFFCPPHSSKHTPLQSSSTFPPFVVCVCVFYDHWVWLGFFAWIWDCELIPGRSTGSLFSWFSELVFHCVSWVPLNFLCSWKCFQTYSSPPVSAIVSWDFSIWRGGGGDLF